jgi:hypothetical protein
MRSSRSALNAARIRASFAWGVVIFLALQLGGGLLLDRYGMAIRFPDAAEVLSEAREQPRNPEIVLLGSSRFEVGLDAGEVSKQLDGGKTLIFNASVPAGDFIATDFMFERLLQDGIQPRLLVLEVSPETLNHRNSWMRFHIHRQLTWRDVPRFLTDILALGDLHILVSERFMPLREHRKDILYAIGWSDLGQNAASPSMIPLGLKHSERLAAASVNVTSELCQRGVELPRILLKDYETGGNAGQAFQRILQRCRQRNIEVILVGVPVTSWYRSTYTPEIEQAFRDYVETIQHAYGCRFIDLRDRVPDAMFVDIHHLNPTGRVFFSRLLASVLDSSFRAK